VTALLGESARRFLQEHSYEAVSASAGALAVGLLIVLLLERTVLRASGEAPRVRSSEVLDVAVAPLFVAFVVIVVVRFARLF
jgi:hypothetical protein